MTNVWNAQFKKKNPQVLTPGLCSFCHVGNLLWKKRPSGKGTGGPTEPMLISTTPVFSSSLFTDGKQSKDGRVWRTGLRSYILRW